MNRRMLVAALALSVAPGTLHAQPGTSHWTFFPRDLQFTPLIANHEEARLGLQQELGSTLLTVGIGNTVDLVQYASGDDTLRAGGDFYAYALANSFRDIRLKIDAADGFFGMHMTWKNSSPWSIRFRALHLSAHLVDGHYDPVLKAWKDGREPIPFSRNYGEIVGARETATGAVTSRLYAGLSFAVYNNPHDIRRWAALGGAEVSTGSTVPFYLACNLSLLGVPTYNLSATVEAGAKFGEWKGRGIRLYLLYYNGLDFYGQYYKDRKEFAGIGFAIDFW